MKNLKNNKNEVIKRSQKLTLDHLNQDEKKRLEEIIKRQVELVEIRFKRNWELSKKLQKEDDSLFIERKSLVFNCSIETAKELIKGNY